MPKKKKRDVFLASKAVKAAAREKIGSPQPTRVVADRKKREVRTEKHKTTLRSLLDQQD